MVIQMEIEQTSLFKKIYGCLIGGLAGDAMGGSSEGMHYKDRPQATKARGMLLTPAKACLYLWLFFG